MNWKMGLLRNMFTQFCVMFQKTPEPKNIQIVNLIELIESVVQPERVILVFAENLINNSSNCDQSRMLPSNQK